MKRSLLSLLVCPQCGEEMELRVFKEHEEIEEGVFICHCGTSYPIVRSVPRLLPRNLRAPYPDFENKYEDKIPRDKAWDEPDADAGELQVRDSYAEQWSRLPGVGLDRPEIEELHWDWFRKKMGFRDWNEFETYFGARSIVLDAGTGRGPKVKKICLVNPECTVIGVDFSESVEKAHGITAGFSNAHIVQADIRRLPFRKGLFDLVVSDGVLHHTPDTKESLARLSGWVSPKGELAVHVYRKLNPIRNFTDSLIREHASRLSISECWEFCRAFTTLGRDLREAGIEIRLSNDAPVLGLKKGVYDLQRFFHYNVSLCFWDEHMSYEENNWVNFDYFHPAYAHRHTEEEVMGWFEELGFSSIRLIPASPFGISIRGVAPETREKHSPQERNREVGFHVDTGRQ